MYQWATIASAGTPVYCLASARQIVHDPLLLSAQGTLCAYSKLPTGGCAVMLWGGTIVTRYRPLACTDTVQFATELSPFVQQRAPAGMNSLRVECCSPLKSGAAKNDSNL